jgi:hypothetical protein
MTEGPRASRPPNPDAAPDPPWRLAGSAARRCPRPQLPQAPHHAAVTVIAPRTTEPRWAAAASFRKVLGKLRVAFRLVFSPKMSALRGPRGKSRAMRSRHYQRTVGHS